MVERYLADAAQTTVSLDGRFAFAYSAALELATMVIACAGYRVKGLGAHETTFVGLRLAMGAGVETICDYFDECRRKRNRLTYLEAGVISKRELRRLLAKVAEFQSAVEAWIARNHPRFTPRP